MAEQDALNDIAKQEAKLVQKKKFIRSNKPCTCSVNGKCRKKPQCARSKYPGYELPGYQWRSRKRSNGTIRHGFILVNPHGKPKAQEVPVLSKCSCPKVRTSVRGQSRRHVHNCSRIAEKATFKAMGYEYTIKRTHKPGPLKKKKVRVYKLVGAAGRYRHRALDALESKEPLCRCNKSARKYKIRHPSSKNNGKYFFGCASDMGSFNRCRYWMLEDDWKKEQGIGAGASADGGAVAAEAAVAATAAAVRAAARTKGDRACHVQLIERMLTSLQAQSSQSTVYRNGAIVTADKLVDTRVTVVRKKPYASGEADIKVETFLTDAIFKPDADLPQWPVQSSLLHTMHGR